MNFTNPHYQFQQTFPIQYTTMNTTIQSLNTSAMRSFCTTKLLTHTVRHPYVNYFPRSLRQYITEGATFKHNFNTSSFAAEQSVHIIKPVTRNDVGAFQPGSSIRKQHVITLHNANTHKHVVTINKYKMYA